MQSSLPLDENMERIKTDFKPVVALSSSLDESEFLTVKKLQMIHSSFKVVKDQHVDHLHLDSNKAKVFERRHHLLRGHLTYMLKKKCGRRTCRQLYLEDESSAIHCQMLHGKVRDLEKEVVCTEWNYIWNDQSGFGFIELIGYLTEEEETHPTVKTACEAMSVRTAKLFLKHEEKSGVKVSLYARICALSEIIKIKEDSLFLVKLKDDACDDTRVDILVNKTNQIFWQNFLTPQEKVVFTRLKVGRVSQAAKHPPDRLETGDNLVQPGKTFSPDPSALMEQLGATRPIAFCNPFSYLLPIVGLAAPGLIYLNLITTVLGDYVAGEEVECLVLIPTQQSNYFMDEDTTVTLLTINDWMQKYGKLAKHRKYSTINEDLQNTVHTGIPRPSLCSYQGTITNDEQAGHGIYVLDSKIGLYLNCLLVDENFKSLRTGTTVTVFNAHKKGSSEPPKIRFYCCVLSCIRIQEFSPYDGTLQLSNQSVALYRSMAKQYNLSLSHYQNILLLEKQLERKLCPDVVRSKCLSQLTKQVLMEAGSDQEDGWLQGQDRSEVMDFLDEAHDNCFALSNNNSNSMPTTPTIQEVLTFCEEKAQEFDASNIEFIPGQPADLNESFYWNYRIISSTSFTPQWILIGVLQGSRTKAGLQLVDQSGKVSCVIPSSHGFSVIDSDEDNENSRSINPNQNTMRQTSRSRVLSTVNCCVLPDMLGRLVRIDKCFIVMERFCLCNFPTINDVGKSRYIHKLETRSYIEFSLHDISCLYSSRFDSLSKLFRIETSSAKCSQGWEFRNQFSSKRLKSGKGEEPCTCRCFNKDVSCSRTNRDPSSSIDRPKFQKDQPISGSICSACQRKRMHSKTEPSSTKATTVSSQDFKTKNPRRVYQTQLFIPCSKDCPQIRSRVNKKPSLSCHIMGVFVGMTQPMVFDNVTGKLRKESSTSATHNSCETGSDSSFPVRYVTLAFTGSSVKWYPALHVGHLYRLVQITSGGQPAFKVILDMTSLTKAVEKANARQYIMLEQDVEIFQVEEVSKDNDVTSKAGDSPKQLLQLSTCEMEAVNRVKKNLHDSGQFARVEQVSDVVKEDYALKLSSFCAVVLSRMFCSPPGDLQQQSQSYKDKVERENSKLGVSVPCSRILRLQVGDQKSCDQVQIYFNLRNISYPLGLLTGAVVHFSNLERKVSRTGRPYYQYGVASSHHIIKLAENESEMLTGGTMDDVQDQEKLTNAIGGYLYDVSTSTASRGVVRFLCHIQRVLKLSIQATCRHCETIFRNGRCSFVACARDTTPNIIAKASVMLDDGTGTALLCCANDAVKTLLDLSDTQWSAVGVQAAMLGCISLTEDPSSAMESFLKRICESCLVRRPVNVWAKRYSSITTIDGRKFADTSEMTIQDFQVKTMTAGAGTVETYNLPLVMLNCLALTTADHADRNQVLEGTTTS